MAEVRGEVHDLPNKLNAAIRLFVLSSQMGMALWDRKEMHLRALSQRTLHWDYRHLVIREFCKHVIFSFVL